DAIGLTPRSPRFVPQLGDVAEPMTRSFSDYVRRVQTRQYPAAEHCYEMPPAEKAEFLERVERIIRF
ncbi:MAG: hypothetical protein JWN51_145, partial [Phycisphaerales bacterium]|nr:hypothetical protein [Phycisphaerales bacterium]